jgi:hypothetical protein
VFQQGDQLVPPYGIEVFWWSAKEMAFLGELVSTSLEG